MPAAPGKNILIVEDERDVSDLLALNLRRAGGFNISTVTDGVTVCERPALKNRP
jgi:DNA-binding response OmpR family regulator